MGEELKQLSMYWPEVRNANVNGHQIRTKYCCYPRKDEQYNPVAELMRKN